MSKINTVKKHRVISLNFVLKNEQGEVLDSSEKGHPLEYLHGAHDIIPGLEKALEGRKLGDRLTVVVPPAEAYGEYEVSLVDEVSRDQFPGVEEIEPGMQFQTQMDDGAPMIINVTAVDEENDTIIVDGNHPLAGVTLVFEVEIIGIRVACQDEIDHGHVHEAGHSCTE
jgi:FKBP-type peptidyl-prolyl cis-trans isomerase SlyD